MEAGFCPLLPLTPYLLQLMNWEVRKRLNVGSATCVEWVAPEAASSWGGEASSQLLVLHGGEKGADLRWLCTTQALTLSGERGMDPTGAGQTDPALPGAS